MSTDSPRMIHIRLSTDLVKKIDYVGVELGLDRARTIETILEVGLLRLAAERRITETAALVAN